MTRYSPGSVAGRPILELGARTWERERYEAFLTCYRTMRAVDDLVDGARARRFPVPRSEQDKVTTEVRRAMLELDGPCGRLHDVRAKFSLPLWPWLRWTQAMVEDLGHNGFRSFRDYLWYSEGAAIAPGAIFMHLCAVRREGEAYHPPSFDVHAAARPLAIFCYLVHVLRDFREDQLQGLHNFPDDVLARYQLERATLYDIARGECAHPGFRQLSADWCRIAERYLTKARQSLDDVRPHLQPAYQLSLDIVLALYQRLHELAARLDGSIERGSLRLPPEEIINVIHGRVGALSGSASGHRFTRSPW